MYIAAGVVAFVEAGVVAFAGEAVADLSSAFWGGFLFFFFRDVADGNLNPTGA